MERIIRKFQFEPTVQIQVANEMEMIDFQPLGDFDVVDDTGKPIFSIENLPLKWRAKLGNVEYAKFVYGLQVTVEKSMDKAEQVANQFKNKGFSTVNTRRTYGYHTTIMFTVWARRCFSWFVTSNNKLDIQPFTD